MNGRCENDALDAAIDVCEECGGEFCSKCLVFPAGRRTPPLCKDCAIANSGVRKRAKRERVQSKGQAKRRRKELRKAQAEEIRARVVHADDLPDFDFEPPTEIVADSAPKKKRLRRRSDDEAEEQDPEEEPTLIEAADAVLAETAPADSSKSSNPNSASRMLDEIRDGSSLDASVGGEAWNFPTKIPKPAGPVVGPGPAPDRKWEPLSNPDASNPFDDPEMGRFNDEDTGGYTAFPAPDLDAGPLTVELGGPRLLPHPLPVSQTPPDEQPDLTAPAFAPEFDTPSPNDAVPPPPTADSTPLGDEDLLAPAPLVQPAEPQPKLKKRLLKRSKSNVEPEGPVVTPEAVQEKVQDPTEDIDAAGQWIPPNLRGMVPETERSDPLPRRRRRHD